MIRTSGPPSDDSAKTPYRHTQQKAASTRARCPVCGQEVYSTAGIHPQCAVRGEDPGKPSTRKKPQAVGE
ncbi:hypothetical protein [Paludisphaera soli]|uniref:hypothetical protein n=1 Tax=Paludisphaera soli TaxID=2712865 RepID=UPI0013EB87CE|nr:hypothetical protein [Paludisphaera soli]